MRKICTLLTIFAMAMTVNAADALGGKFTINSDGDQVVFSKGNLQATTTDLGDHWTWGFAENQWDFIGDAAANNAINGDGRVSANGTVDLFGWSTESTYFGINASTENDDYAGNFREWGDNIPGGWRTLSIAEWKYILKNRTNADNLCGQATVNDVHGFVFLPDDADPAALGFVSSYYAQWAANIFTEEQWNDLQDAGAIFLPATGYRYGTNVSDIGEEANYWSTTPYDGSCGCSLFFNAGNSYASDAVGTNRKECLAVRLVQDVKKPQTKSMTPVSGYLSWSESLNEWYVDALDANYPDGFYFSLSAAGAKSPMPASLVLSGATDDRYTFTDGADPDFGGVINNANLTLSYDGGLYTDNNDVYIRAKISGEVSNNFGDKLIINEPSDFIEFIVDGIDIPTSIDEIVNRKSSNRKLFLDGTLYILRDGKTYNIMGAEVE